MSRLITRLPGHYSSDNGYFATSGVDNAPLHALADGVDGGNGVYVYGTGNTFPSNTYQSSNYWVDVVFTTSGGADTTPPNVASVSPTAGAIGIATTTSSQCSLQRTGECRKHQCEAHSNLFGPSNTLVPATITYTSGSQTATLTPSAALAYLDCLHRGHHRRKQWSEGRHGQCDDREFHLVIYNAGRTASARHVSVHGVDSCDRSDSDRQRRQDRG